MEREAELKRFEQELKTIIGEMERVAKDLDTPLYTIIPVYTHREILIANKALIAIAHRLERIEKTLQAILATLKQQQQTS